MVVLATAAAVVVSCSRPWPAEPPDAHEWQLMVAPANLVPEQTAGTAVAALAFAQERPRPPACDGIGEDDCADYLGRYGRQLPARLTVACWNHNTDGEGALDITFTPSRPLLDDPGLHPSGWSGWGLDFDGDSGDRDVIMEMNDDGSSLRDGFVAYVPGGQRTDTAVTYFRQTARQDGAELRVFAFFPESEGGNPLEWRFRLDPQSRADERIRHVVENCGGVW
jgi:hypothetical protein